MTMGHSQSTGRTTVSGHNTCSYGVEGGVRCMEGVEDVVPGSSSASGTSTVTLEQRVSVGAVRRSAVFDFMFLTLRVLRGGR